MNKNLKLKDSFKEFVETGRDIVLRSNKTVSRKITFPIDTPQEDYYKWHKAGYRIFVCKNCEKEYCDGNCEIIIPQEETFEIDNYDKKIQEAEELQEAFENNIEIVELEDMQLKDLRLLYPNISARSKEDFLKQVRELDK